MSLLLYYKHIKVYVIVFYYVGIGYDVFVRRFNKVFDYTVTAYKVLFVNRFSSF